jgi:pimeloyl-ACP methyl ester carboxylesterase
VTRPELAGIVRQSGLISADADIGALVELVEGVAACDLKILLTSYEAVVGDPAASLLQEIPMPVLLAAGDKDQFTSRRMLEEMEGSLPDVRRLEYRGATHFLPVEQPEALARDLRGFFAEAV